MKVFENNQATLSGEIVGGFEFDHKTFDESFYTVKIAIERTSGKIDTLPVMISERLIDVGNDCTGMSVTVKGQMRTFNKYTESGSKLLMFVFAQEIEFVEDEYFDCDNCILLDGFICKPPIYRKTPLGREITDIMIAVNRPYGKSDYIPCLAWGRNAQYAQWLEVGARLKIEGRLQSREYLKRLSDDESEVRTAYEVSIKSMKVADDERKGEKYAERTC